MMNKKLMVVAIGAAFAVPAVAFAAADISGRVNAGIGTYGATGASFPTPVSGNFESRKRVWDSGSQITVKASEDLGGGLKVEAYIETGINVDTGTGNGQSGGANSGSGFFGSRQAWAGISGTWGKVTFGRQNTWYGSGDQDLAQAVWLDTGIQFATGVLQVGPGINRLSNSARYTSPMLGPVEVLLTFGTSGEAAGAGTNNVGVAASKVVALTIQGSQGPFSGGIDQVTNTINNPIVAATANVNVADTIATTTKASGLKLRGGFKYMPGAQISVILVKDKTTSNSDNFSLPGYAIVNNAINVANVLAANSSHEFKQDAIQINWEHQIGSIGLHAGYGKAKNFSVDGAEVPDTSTKAIQVGARYILSKSAYVYVNMVKYSNDAGTNLDFNAGGMSSAGLAGLPGANLNGTAALVAGGAPGVIGINNGGSLGADPKTLSVGLSYRF